MARYTLAEAQQHLDAWKAAELALATGQSYSIAGRSLTRVNLADVMQQIRYWQKQIEEIKAEMLGRRKPNKQRRYVPTDS